MAASSPRTTRSTAQFERSVADLTAVNQYTGATDKLMVAMADQAEMKLLHMWVPADPNRNASFTYFARPELLPDRLPRVARA